MLPELDRLAGLVEQIYEQADLVPHRARDLRLSRAHTA